MPPPIVLSLILTTVITFFITSLEISNLTNGRLRSILINYSYWIYFAIQLLGNLVTTWLSFFLLKDKLPDDLDVGKVLVYSFVGVFSFWGVLSNTNIDLLGSKVLTIQEWLQKAKDTTKEYAVEKDATYKVRERMDIALKLKDCDEEIIKSVLVTGKTDKERKQSNKDAMTCGGDVKFYRCLQLAYQDIESAKEIIKSHNKELAMTKEKYFDLD